MLRIAESVDLRDIYGFQLNFESPFFFNVSFEDWRKSFEEDTDGEGRKLFKELNVKTVYDNGNLLGFVQYGKTAFGFAENGEISSEVSYNVIRNLYFAKGSGEVGRLLLDEAVGSFGGKERIYAFFHYFGMSCFARHGKLFEKHTHIEDLLKENSFEIEHENVYYSSDLIQMENSEVAITAHDMTKGNQQYLDFSLVNTHAGGCEVHYLSENTAYLRWIYVNGDMVGKGIGTKCMKALTAFLHEKGIKRFDTDTALNNIVAQRYYEKNGFIRRGITRSYYSEAL